MPHDHKRASEISQLSESALAEIDALPDDDDERLQNLEATKPSKMVLGESSNVCHQAAPDDTFNTA